LNYIDGRPLQIAQLGNRYFYFVSSFSGKEQEFVKKLSRFSQFFAEFENSDFKGRKSEMELFWLGIIDCKTAL
jgi:hypothetical protein